MNEASQAEVVNAYRYTKLKLHNTISALKFNKECRRLNIKPNYVKVKCSGDTEAAKITQRIAERLWVKHEIKFLHKKKGQLNAKLYRSQLVLNNTLHPTEAKLMVDKVEEWMQPILDKKRKTIENKLTRLNAQKAPTKLIQTTHQFYPRLVNLSNTQLSDSEEKLLHKGLKHSLIKTNDIKDLQNTMLDVESTVQSLPVDQRNEVRYETINKVSKLLKNRKNVNNKNGVESRLAKNLCEKFNRDDTTVLKADKGNTIVLMKREVHDQKIQEFLDNNDIVKLKKDPTNTYHKEINKAISRCQHIFTPETKRSLKVTNPIPPKLRGLPKIHKDGIPMRPLINAINSPTYRVAKAMNKILKRSIDLPNNKSLSNSLDLIDKIKNIVIPNGARLVSFDVKNLYTSVPIKETLTITDQLLRKNSNISKDEREEIMEVTTKILEQNYFEHNGEFYIQQDGLAMGSPLSGTLADIFLNHFENAKILNPVNRQVEKIIYWHRYVDDIITLFKGNSRQIQILNKYLNGLHQKLVFTSEEEIEGKLNYLDITITSQLQKHIFKIYRKPTQTNMVIHETSNHPRAHKLAAFRSLLHRLETVPMEKPDYQDELNTIRYIAQENGYMQEIVNKIHTRIKKNKKQRHPPTQENSEPKNYSTLEYHNLLEHTLSNIFRKRGVKTAYRTTNKLGDRLKPKPKHVQDSECSGVYKLRCNECEKYYVGQTGRPFKTRFREHTDALRLPNKKSNFADHLVASGHTYTSLEQNLVIMHKLRKSRKLSRWEEYEIYNGFKDTPDKILNDRIITGANPIYDNIRRFSHTHVSTIQHRNHGGSANSNRIDTG